MIAFRLAPHRSGPHRQHMVEVLIDGRVSGGIYADGDTLRIISRHLKGSPAYCTETEEATDQTISVIQIELKRKD